MATAAAPGAARASRAGSRTSFGNDEDVDTQEPVEIHSRCELHQRDFDVVEVSDANSQRRDPARRNDNRGTACREDGATSREAIAIQTKTVHSHRREGRDRAARIDQQPGSTVGNADIDQQHATVRALAGDPISRSQRSRSCPAG